MFDWWNSLEFISQLRWFLGWTAAFATVLGLVFQMRLSSLQKVESDKSKIVTKSRLDEANQRALALEERQKPWDFSPAQWKSFIEHLKVAPKGKVAFGYIRSDESRIYDLTVKLSEILKSLDYDVWGYIPGIQQAGSAPLTGIMIQFMGPETYTVGNAIQQAFQAIDIKSITTIRNNSNYESDVTVIWVGSKP